MSLFDSLRRGVDHLPGGRVVAAVRTSKNDEVLRKELSGAASHKLGALDALAVARVCVEAGSPHCYDYAAFVADECGGEFRPRDRAGAATHTPMQRVAMLARETADVTESVLDALADGVVSDNELAAIESEIAQAEEVLRKLRQAARAVNAAGKPRGVVELPVRYMSPEAA